MVTTPTPPPGNPFGIIRSIKLEEEMRSSYLDYAMSVIVARALPDVRDGLKPVHRRILYAMDEQNIRPGTPYRKSARIVGEVLGKYHPHGDAPVYDALVRMAQPFSMRYPLVDGQGNFGSVDNDPPAAMRYTEARLAGIAMEVLADIDQETVDFTANFDSSLREPLVLPARLPNLLVNGSSGIAVGMATNIPPHNLSEVCDGIIYLIEHEDASIDDLVKLVKGPDFPTGATIMGRAGILEAFHTGHGRVVQRARAEIEEIKNREQIVVTEIPYQVNKATLIEKIAELVKDKRIDGISEVRDESDRDGMRIVIELRRDAMPEQVLNNLYKMTALQSSFFINMLALVDGTPRTLNLRQILHEYVNFRQEIVRRRSEYQLRKAQERAHILEGLLKAIENLDAVIETIRNSADAETARANLMQQYTLTQIQAQAILDLQLRRLAALERQRIEEEFAELQKTIAYLTDLLGDPKKILAVVKAETIKLKEDFGDKRVTKISNEEAREFADEDLIPHVNVAISISNRGYAKRLPMEAYRIQRRGGQGKIGMITREQDVVEHLLITDTHDHLLFFTNKGRVLHLKTYRIPQEATRAARGTPLINLIPITPDERVTAVVATNTFDFDRYLMLFTRNGRTQLTAIKEFAYVLERTKGINAMKLAQGDELVSVAMVAQADHVIATTEHGRSLRFPVKDVTPHHRNSMGVRGMRVQKGDRIISFERARDGAFLMVLGAKGLGKLTKLESYTEHHRGTGGITTLKITPRTGPVAAARVVDNDDELMVISKGGIMLRTTLAQVRITGRTAQGVRIMEVGENDTVASTATFGPQIAEAEAAAAAAAALTEAAAEAEEAPEEDEAEEETPKGKGKLKAKATKAKPEGKGKAPAKPAPKGKKK